MNSRILSVLALVAPAALAAASVAPKQATKLTPVSFNRDIRPILSDNCFACHGPDRNKRQANLRLDTRADAVGSGAIVPGDPSKSRILARVFAKADDPLLMPPASSHKSLTPAQKALLSRWVSQGAVYEAHWSYVAPKKQAVPTVTVPGYRQRNAIDAFVNDALAKKKIAPSAEADRRTLIRRASLDLTGLPPTPAEIDAFLSDNKPGAYERVVDRLLGSPHFGERMATPWLDGVRYADTVGFHGDQNQNAWGYRDWVVNSFNTNLPYDRFVTEQLAGDLLPNPTPEQLTATAFNRLNMVTREGGAQAKEYLAKYAADRVRAVGMAFLGSTLGCCECHDHKYDPFKQRDFYQIAAYFGDVQQWGVYADYGYTPNPELRGYNNDFPFPPEITIESPFLKERIADSLRKRARLAKTSLAAAKPETLARFDAWRASAKEFLAAHPDGWAALSPQTPTVTTGGKPSKVAATTEGGTLILDGAGDADVSFSAPAVSGSFGALRVEILPGPDGSVLRKGAPVQTLTLAVSVVRAGGKSEKIGFWHASANQAEPRYNNGFEILGVQRGWRFGGGKNALVSVWLPGKPLALAPDDRLAISLTNCAAAKVRISVSPLVPENPDTQTFPTDLSARLSDTAGAWAQFVASGAEADASASIDRTLAERIVACRKGLTPVLVTKSVAPAPVRVLPRGNWQDETGEVVTPNPPGFLLASNPSATKQPDARQTRLDLARWIVAKENPLTARVFVNRLWKLFFGAGLSAQIDDLGAQGEWPTHPELLDYLAVDFGADWNIKRAVRQIVLSDAYRRSSTIRKDLQNIDPQNRLLARQNTRRLDAEFVRDNVLAIAGALDGDIGGPPVKPYQPAGYYSAIQFPDRPYAADSDDLQFRRGLYTHWQRTFLHPMLANFDAPSREEASCTRTLANTPQQALTLLNDPTFVEAARLFADSLLTKPGNDSQRLETAFVRALARKPTAAEKTALLGFLKRVRTEYAARPGDAEKLLAIGISKSGSPGDPIERAAWTNVCRVLLNLHETITRE